MEPPSPYSISISNESGLPLRQAPIRNAVRATLSRHGKAPGEVAVMVMGNAAIQELNRNFRKVDEPTDVLTFPAPESSFGSSQPPSMIGDIAISAEYAQAQAALRGVPLEDEIAYLALHGALHLCGFDDETDDDRRAMQIEMAEMGRLLGLVPDPAWSSLLHAAGEPGDRP